MITIEDIRSSYFIPTASPELARFDVLNYALAECGLDAVTNGMILEFGVDTGSTINHIANYVHPLTVYGFDWWKGLPDDWVPGFPKGTFNRDGQQPQVAKNVTLISGLFADTLPQFLRTHLRPIAFLHIDCDIYESASCVLTHLTGLIVPGTIIVFDELHNYTSYADHEFKALNEFLSITGLAAEALCHNSFEQVAIKIL